MKYLFRQWGRVKQIIASRVSVNDNLLIAAVETFFHDRRKELRSYAQIGKYARQFSPLFFIVQITDFFQRTAMPHIDYDLPPSWRIGENRRNGVKNIF